MVLVGGSKSSSLKHVKLLGVGLDVTNGDEPASSRPDNDDWFFVPLVLSRDKLGDRSALCIGWGDTDDSDLGHDACWSLLPLPRETDELEGGLI